MADQEKELRKAAPESKNKDKKKWERPDVTVYSINNTLFDGAVHNDGSLSS